jgi:hypothetical protein
LTTATHAADCGAAVAGFFMNVLYHVAHRRFSPYYNQAITALARTIVPSSFVAEVTVFEIVPHLRTF